MNEEKKITWLSVVLFSILLTGMALKKQYPPKQAVQLLYDKCPHDTIDPSRYSIGSIKSFTVDDKRKVFIKEVAKY